MNNLFCNATKDVGATYILLDGTLRLLDGRSIMGKILTPELINSPRVDLSKVETTFTIGLPIKNSSMLVIWNLPNNSAKAIFLVDYLNNDSSPVLRHVLNQSQANRMGIDTGKTQKVFTNPDNYKYGPALSIFSGEFIPAKQLEIDMDDTETNTSQLESDLNTVYQDLQTIDKDLNVSKEINSSINNLSNILHETQSLLTVVSIIPEISGEVNDLKDAITVVQNPVAQALSASNRIENIVGPIRTKIGQIEPKIKKVDNALLSLKKAELKFIDGLDGALKCVQSLPISSFRTSLADKLNTACGTFDPKVILFNSKQLSLLNGIGKAQSECNKIEQDALSLVKLNVEINGIIGKLRPILDPLKDIQVVLGHVITVKFWCFHYSCSIEELLKDADKFIEPIMKLFMKLINPILKPLLAALHLNIQISLPGMGIINNLQVELEKIDLTIFTPLNNLINEIKGIEEFAQELESLEEQIAKLNASCSAAV
jgi:hypothetical protein